jgi:hypothetical protein
MKLDRVYKLYLAGAMRGHKHFNRHVFAEAAMALRAEGHVVFSPTEFMEAIYGDNVLLSNETGDEKEAAEGYKFDNRKFVSGCLAFICLDADAVIVLPNSEKSQGTNLERSLAEDLHIPVIEYKAETLN